MEGVDQSTLLIIAAVVLAGLFIFALARRLVKMAIFIGLVAFVVMGLYLARAQGAITW